jgi:hypothetical protein
MATNTIPNIISFCIAASKDILQWKARNKWHVKECLHSNVRRDADYSQELSRNRALRRVK